MAVPVIIANVAISTTVKTVKKHPWLIPIIIFALLFPTLIIGGAVYSATMAAQQITNNQGQQCSEEYQSFVTQFNEQYSSPVIAGSTLVKSCGPEYGSLVFSAEGWTNPTIGPVFDEWEDPANPRYQGRHYGSTGTYLRVRPHSGIDISPGCGTPIYAVQDGVVTSTGSSGTLGLFTKINHGNGISSGYAHQKSGTITVKAGDSVVAGQQIGEVGNTGAVACHLHFMIFNGNSTINPRLFMDAVGINLG
jgi:murein DD-endopeptidase MepM/ murein hydrolase activator NlpD